MTKEEIIKKYEPYPNKAEVNIIGLMMDEYAKFQSVAFGEWISTHRLDFQPAKGGKWIGLDMMRYTNEELYTQFLDHQKQQP